MTYSSSPSVVLSMRPRTGRAFAALREWLQTLHARRHDLQAQRRDARTRHAVSEMDAHLLRDIGAPEELIARAVEDRNSRVPREFLFQLATVAAAITMIAMPEPAFAADGAGSETTGKRVAQQATPGVFTGQFAEGGPVYRFPSVVVTGSRRAELPRSESPLAQRRPARNATARRPA